MSRIKNIIVILEEIECLIAFSSVVQNVEQATLSAYDNKKKVVHTRKKN